MALLAEPSVPNFFSLGNHEFYHAPERILVTMARLESRILRRDHQTLGELNIIGIDDAREPKTVDQALRDESLIDESRFNVLMYHRPTGVDDAQKRGVDLMLSGHTHGGQFFPYVWLLHVFFKYKQGLNQIGDMVLFVTDGVGLWGPPLRIGSKNALAVIEILPISAE